MPVETIGSTGGIPGAAKKQALESEGPQVLRNARQQRPSYSATLILWQQREHEDFTRVLVAKAVANHTTIVCAYMARNIARLNLLAPGLSGDTERSKAAHGNGVLTSLAPQRYNFRGVRRNCGLKVKCRHYVVFKRPNNKTGDESVVSAGQIYPIEFVRSLQSCLAQQSSA
jgi:hypothetical protein